MSKINTMLKIDIDRFDKMLELELRNDEAYNNFISEYTNSNADDELINSIVLRASEIIYSKGFKDGMNLIIKREEISFFD